MEMIDKYLDEVCDCITSVPCRRAVRRELQNHIMDSVENAEKSGADGGEAAERVIAEMGSAREMGQLLNRHFSIRPDIRLIVYIFAIFCLYTIAALGINYSISDTVLALLSGGGCTVLFYCLKRTDLEARSHLIKYIYFATLLLLWAAGMHTDWQTGRDCMSAGGTILLFCVTFFVYRLHRNGMAGLIMALCLFLLPIPLFMSLSADGALFLYLAAGIYTFAYFIIQGRGLENRNKLVFALIICAMLGTVVWLFRTRIFTKWILQERFFLRDGLDHFPYLTENFRTYPLAACISGYGSWTALAYIILFILVLAELLRMKKRVHYFWGRNLLNCIFLILSLKGIFAVLLNLGIPLIRSCMLPFAGFGPDQISNFLLVVMAEYVYCFGDAVFADCSFFEEHKLFERENGKIIIYTR